ncbi:MAG: hypothetical protein M1812_004073 [Candelaria pacifica]|nr:MAG: hypothetical protein M1812_004073 [Candelaria pacifica]
MVPRDPPGGAHIFWQCPPGMHLDTHRRRNVGFYSPGARYGPRIIHAAVPSGYSYSDRGYRYHSFGDGPRTPRRFHDGWEVSPGLLRGWDQHRHPSLDNFPAMIGGHAPRFRPNDTPFRQSNDRHGGGMNRRDHRGDRNLMDIRDGLRPPSVTTEGILGGRDGEGPHFRVFGEPFYADSVRDLPANFRDDLKNSEMKGLYHLQAYENLFSFLNKNKQRYASIDRSGPVSALLYDEVETYYLAKEVKIKDLQGVVLKRLTQQSYPDHNRTFPAALKLILDRNFKDDKLLAWAHEFCLENDRMVPLLYRNLDALPWVPQNAVYRRNLDSFLDSFFV